MRATSRAKSSVSTEVLSGDESILPRGPGCPRHRRWNGHRTWFGVGVGRIWRRHRRSRPATRAPRSNRHRNPSARTNGDRRTHRRHEPPKLREARRPHARAPRSDRCSGQLCRRCHNETDHRVDRRGVGSGSCAQPQQRLATFAPRSQIDVGARQRLHLLARPRSRSSRRGSQSRRPTTPTVSTSAARSSTRDPGTRPGSTRFTLRGLRSTPTTSRPTTATLTVVPRTVRAMYWCVFSTMMESPHAISGRYIDRLEKRDGEWKIALRRSTVELMFTADASGLQSQLFKDQGYPRGTRDQRDLSYLRPLTLEADALER